MFSTLKALRPRFAFGAKCDVASGLWPETVEPQARRYNSFRVVFIFTSSPSVAAARQRWAELVQPRCSWSAAVATLSRSTSNCIRPLTHSRPILFHLLRLALRTQSRSAHEFQQNSNPSAPRCPRCRNTFGKPFDHFIIPPDSQETNPV